MDLQNGQPSSSRPNKTGGLRYDSSKELGIEFPGAYSAANPSEMCAVNDDSCLKFFWDVSQIQAGFNVV